ncbi:Uncharacterized protein APZ42_014434 [Daphnia magna]|uniref:Reverse transcriptase RNase H-like domain-containing protein n=1 Tax=Daphnia magna TaxID=35525 RepID=A0A162PWC4_9CRUS|nr:Uncharacterized protein APZ42_014434 [Daphnia magna]
MLPRPNLNANEKAKRKWVKSFVGLCSFYRKFAPNFAHVAYLLTVMEGAALMQERNGHPIPICFISRVLNKSERNYTITEKECLAVVWAVKKFQPYIWAAGLRDGVCRCIFRADTGSEDARAETEEGMTCAETDTGEMPEADTGVTPDTSTAAAAVEPPSRRENGTMRRRPLEPIAEIDEGLQDGKDSVVPAATESPAGRPTMKKRAPGLMKNILFFTLVCVVGQIVQANEMREKYVVTEGAVFHPEDDMARAFGIAITGNFPMEVNPFLEGPARDLAEIKARAERWRQEFRELERALKMGGTRRKRGLFDGGGQLLNWLFGTATTKDLESVHSRLKSFYKKGLEVVHLSQEQASLLNVTISTWRSMSPKSVLSWRRRVRCDRQLFVEFNVDEVRKGTPYMGSVCLFLKPIDRKGRIKSCVAAVFLQKQEGIQRNCHLDSKKWTGFDMFHIGGRNWGYAGKDNVTIVLQCPGKRIGRIDLPQGLPAAGMMPVNVTSVIDEEAAGMLSGLLAPVVKQSQPVTKSPIMGEGPAALRTPTRIDLAGKSSHLKAVERLRRQWEEEENAKRYPF